MHSYHDREKLRPIVEVVKRATKFTPKLVSTFGKQKLPSSILKFLIVSVLSGSSQERQINGSDIFANYIGTPISYSVAGIVIYDDHAMNLEDLERRINKFKVQLDLHPPFDYRGVAKFYFPATTIFVHGMARDHAHCHTVGENLQKVLRKYGCKRRVQVYDVVYQLTEETKSFLISLEIDLD